jgi:hypothetical protein
VRPSRVASVSRRNRANLLLVGVSLVGALVLGLAVWAAAEADDEPTATTLAVADLAPAADEAGKGRLEIVETGDRVWVKLQVRGLTATDATLLLAADSATEPLEIPVTGDGDYSVTDEIPLDGAAELRQDGRVLLAGRLEASE